VVPLWCACGVPGVQENDELCDLLTARLPRGPRHSVEETGSPPLRLLHACASCYMVRFWLKRALWGERE